MRTSIFFLFLNLLLSLVNPALIYIPNVSIDPILIYQVQVSCDRLQANLRATYGTAFQNTFIMYSQAYAANYFLQTLSNDPQIKPYVNVVVGSNNTANATKSMIIGNNNNVLGTGNYVFSKNFNSATAGATDNNLVLDQWLIKLSMLQNINDYLLYNANPKNYISKW